MAGKTATLTVKIISDAKDAKKGFEDAGKGAKDFERGLDKASIAAGATLGAIGVLAKQSFDAASALQQTTGAVEAVFGAQADAVKKLADAAVGSAGLARSEYQEFATLIGSQLTNMGVAADELVPKTDALIRTGADLAAQFGGTTQDAVAALSSALKGERDPIERYGISLTQAGINSQIAAMGLDTSTEAAKRQATATATMALIAEQGGSALGAFGREANTAAGQQQRATAAWENAKAALGEALLPVVSAAAEAFAELAGWMAQNTGLVQGLVIVVASLAAGVLLVNGAIKTYRAIATIATAAQWLWNAALAANPLGLIVLAIAAVIAIVILMYNKFSWFRDLVGAIGGFFVSVWNNILTAIEAVRGVVSMLGGAFQAAMSVAAGAVQALLAPVQWLWDKLSMVWDLIGSVGSAVGDFLFGAPTVAVTGGPAAAGLYGAAGPAPLLYGAAMTSGPAGVGPAGRTAAPPTSVINVTINGAVDRVGTARELQRLLADYGVITGRTRTVTVGR